MCIARSLSHWVKCLPMIYVTSECINMLTCQLFMFGIHSIYGCALGQVQNWSAARSCWRISLQNGLTSRRRWNGITLAELGTFGWNCIHLWARYLLETFQCWLSDGSFPWVIKSICYWNTEKSRSIILKESH